MQNPAKTLITFLALMVAAYTYIPSQSFEDLDPMEYQDKNRLKEFIDCVGFKGCCTWQELLIRDRAPKIVQSNCSDCSENEKKIVAQLTVFIANLNTTNLKSLMTIYDPSGDQTRRYFNDLNTVNEESGLPKIPEEVIDEYKNLDETSCF